VLHAPGIEIIRHGKCCRTESKPSQTPKIIRIENECCTFPDIFSFQEGSRVILFKKILNMYFAIFFSVLFDNAS